MGMHGAQLALIKIGDARRPAGTAGPAVQIVGGPPARTSRNRAMHRTRAADASRGVRLCLVHPPHRSTTSHLPQPAAPSPHARVGARPTAPVRRPRPVLPREEERNPTACWTYVLPRQTPRSTGIPLLPVSVRECMHDPTVRVQRDRRDPGHSPNGAESIEYIEDDYS
jgi:hypothetical protein